MEIVFKILESIPVILFWSAVLSYVPTVYYLLIRNPPLLKAEKMREKGIIVLGQDRMVRKAETTRVMIISIIYGLCVVCFSIIYFINASHDRIGIKPFDIASTLFIILFVFSVITYLPIAFYLMLKNPWQDREEAGSLTGIFIGYGIAILIFSLIFSFHWLKAHQIPSRLSEFFSSFLVILFSSVVIAYLPVCIYVFSQIANPYRLRRIHPNVIFVIYSSCFLIFASIFVANWVSDKF